MIIDILCIVTFAAIMIYVIVAYIAAVLEAFDLLNRLSEGKTCVEHKHPVLKLFNYFKSKNMHNGVALLGVVFALLLAPITIAVYFGIPFFKWCIRK